MVSETLENGTAVVVVLEYLDENSLGVRIT